MHTRLPVTGTSAVLAGLVALAWLGLAQPTLAACSLTAEAVAAAPIAFVGTLTDVSADGAQAIFEVEDVWRGLDLSAGVSSPEVVASPGRFQMPPAGTPAIRFLVLAHTVDGMLRTGDECRLFPFPWDASYAAFRPRAAPPSATGDAEPAGIPGPVLMPIVAAAVMVVIGFFAFRRRGSPG